MKPTKKMKQPNNLAIASLIGLNILISILILINQQEPNVDNIAYANSIDNIEPSRKGNSEEVDNEEENEDIIFNVETVTSEYADVDSMPLYFSHANEHGTFFTYAKTEKPQTWTQGYWYIDYNTLYLANINPTLLKHNDEIQGVFYPSVDENGDYFEIKEVVAKSKEYSYQ